MSAELGDLQLYTILQRLKAYIKFPFQAKIPCIYLSFTAANTVVWDVAIFYKQTIFLSVYVTCP